MQNEPNEDMVTDGQEGQEDSETSCKDVAMEEARPMYNKR